MFGYRNDGKKVKKQDALHYIFCEITPKRSQAEVSGIQTADVTNLVKYIKEKNNSNPEIHYTFFYAVATAMAKTVYNNPLLNRFIVKKRFYDRNEVSISFPAKVSFEDDAIEYTSKVTIEPSDTLKEVSIKLNGEVERIRNQRMSTTDKTIDFIGHLPRFLRIPVMGFVKWMSREGIVPKYIRDSNAYDGTVLISNLGSIECDAIYHHLVDFGTNSFFLAVGRIRKETAKAPDGSEETRYLLDIGTTIDNRIADGYYFAKSVKMLKTILANPALLEDRADAKVDMEFRK
jgi:hypothetical protein